MMNLIVAIGKNGEIGKNGDLIWKIPNDLKRFKTLTMGNPVIMGRKTWESLPKKPLPGRKNIILSRKKDFKAEGAEVVNSIEEVINLTKNDNPFVIGGAEIYNAFLPKADRLYLTVVDAECKEADAFLNPELWKNWEIIEETPLEVTSTGIPYRYITYQNRQI